MQNLTGDFDVLAERADDCGARWAGRVWQHSLGAGAVPADWPGTLEEARRLVNKFASRAGYAEREGLANILWYAAEWAWSNSLQSMRMTASRAAAAAAAR